MAGTRQWLCYAIIGTGSTERAHHRIRRVEFALPCVHGARHIHEQIPGIIIQIIEREEMDHVDVVTAAAAATVAAGAGLALVSGVLLRASSSRRLGTLATAAAGR